jgi:hypothetical protein
MDRRAVPVKQERRERSNNSQRKVFITKSNFLYTQVVFGIDARVKRTERRVVDYLQISGVSYFAPHQVTAVEKLSDALER